MDDPLETLNIEDAELRAFAKALLIEHLGGDERWMALCLYHIEGKTEAEIATRLCVTQQAVGKRLRAARVKLRRLGVLPEVWDKSSEKAGKTG